MRKAGSIAVVSTALFVLAGVTPAQVLSGAGATFPYPLYKKWFATFQKKFPALGIQYRAIGSGAGIDALAKGQTDFAASDIPLSNEELTTYPTPIKHIPTTIGAVVVIYKLEGPPRELRFTPEALSGIYLGTIKRWNHPMVRAANRDAVLPDAEIKVVHRSDRSGTSYIWSSYLASVSPEWKAMRAAPGGSNGWPTGMPAEGNDGVAELVSKTPNSIGYVEFFYALDHRLSYGRVRNRAGQFETADLTTLSAAAVDMPLVPAGDLRISLANAQANNAYPISGLTYLLVPTRFDMPGKGNAMREFLRWMLETGQKQCGALGYAALPVELIGQARRAVDQISFDPKP